MKRIWCYKIENIILFHIPPCLAIFICPQFERPRLILTLNLYVGPIYIGTPTTVRLSANKPFPLSSCPFQFPNQTIPLRSFGCFLHRQEEFTEHTRGTSSTAWFQLLMLNCICHAVALQRKHTDTNLICPSFPVLRKVGLKPPAVLLSFLANIRK